MNDIKVCPDCNTEFYSHVSNCSDCGITLLYSNEIREIETSKAEILDPSVKEVVIKSGTSEWLRELADMLLEKNISCRIFLPEGCNKCQGEYVLTVKEEDSEKGVQYIEEYFEQLYPEIKESKDLLANGNCPACGYFNGVDAKECNDCGLPLIEEMEPNLDQI